jgi:hypothetical protein
MRAFVLQLFGWIFLPLVASYLLASISPHGLSLLFIGGLILSGLGCCATFLRYILMTMPARTQVRYRTLEGFLLGLMALPIASLILEGHFMTLPDALQLSVMAILALIGSGVGVAIGRALALQGTE